MTEYDSTKDTRQHIKKSQYYLSILFLEIAVRHTSHDLSKLESPEKGTFDRVTPLLKELTYGSPEYNTVLESMQEALDHHYAKNNHHPEHFVNGMRGMTLVDLLEMFCDWCAATERHDDGNIGKSIAHNMQRFGYGDTLASIMVNTAQLYCMGRRKHTAYRPDNKEQEGEPQ